MVGGVVGLGGFGGGFWGFFLLKSWGGESIRLGVECQGLVLRVCARRGGKEQSIHH